MTLIPTPWQTTGPYLHIGLTNSRAIACIAGQDVKGERVSLKLRLLDGDGKPVQDGMFEIWQADADGRYRHPEDAAYDERRLQEGDSFLGFGRMATAEDGACSFETVRPGRVASLNGLQAPHLNLGVFGRGLLKRLATRVYFAGDAGNDQDPALLMVPADRRHTLLAQPQAEKPGAWWMDIYLSGDAETVFFDI
jgi:protocatechuate 3,4-dioxygenase alpha subunit